MFYEFELEDFEEDQELLQKVLAYSIVFLAALMLNVIIMNMLIALMGDVYAKKSDSIAHIRYEERLYNLKNYYLLNAVQNDQFNGWMYSTSSGASASTTLAMSSATICCILVEREGGLQASSKMESAGRACALAFGRVRFSSYAILKFTATDAVVRLPANDF